MAEQKKKTYKVDILDEQDVYESFTVKLYEGEAQDVLDGIYFEPVVNGAFTDIKVMSEYDGGITSELHTISQVCAWDDDLNDIFVDGLQYSWSEIK